MTFNYLTEDVQAKYICSQCQADGVKLWRDVVAVATAVDLLCADCAMKDAGKIIEIDRDGKNDDGIRISDQMFGLVPAVPTEDGKSFWGYTSVPPLGVAWWRSLPLRN